MKLLPRQLLGRNDERSSQKSPSKETILDVAEPGVEPDLSDYEPDVQPYTTPHVIKGR